MNRPSDTHPTNGLYTHPNAHVRVDSGKPGPESWLNGQGVLVFGGATGACAAAVRALAEAGAYVTIADSNANEGQRLMLELVGRNLRVQYTFTNLPVFRSQTEAIHYASVFSPTSTLSVIICAAIPPPALPRGPSLSILSWLRTTTTDSTFPNPLPPPSTAPLDRAITATYHAVHLALHHFRQSPPLIPQRNGMPHHHHNASSTSAKSASSSPLSHPANHSPTSFKTAGTSTSAHAPAVPSQPAPALPLDPSTALHAHPVVSSENGETSTSPKCPTTPGSLPAPGVPVPLSAAELILPSPESPAGRALEASMQTLNLTADLPPCERKHLVVLAPAAFLSEDVDDADDDAHADGGFGRGCRALHALPSHHLAERAASAGLRAMVKALEELCEADAVGPGINVGCIPCEEDDAPNGHADPKGSINLGQESANSPDERCVRAVMRMLCGISPADVSGDGDIVGDPARAGIVDVGGDILVTQDDALLALDRDLEADLLLADEPTDVEADADDEASASALDDDDEDSSSSSTTHSTSLMLAARSVAPLDRPSPSASRIALPPALGQVREEEEDEKGMSPVVPKEREKDDHRGRELPTERKAVGDEDDEEEEEQGRAVGDDVLGVIGTAKATATRGDADADELEQQQERRASSGSRYDEKSKSDDTNRDTERETDVVPKQQQQQLQPQTAAPEKSQSQSQSHAPAPLLKDAVVSSAAATTQRSSSSETNANTTALPQVQPTRPAAVDNMKPLPAVPGELGEAGCAAASASDKEKEKEKEKKKMQQEAAVATADRDGNSDKKREKETRGGEVEMGKEEEKKAQAQAQAGAEAGRARAASLSSDMSETF